ncbi:hypothetical protein [Flagellimonas abyssi]|jgi:hypothetical protein|uniref:DUF2383 domain-containing protein n=1 Tax=Flagellimonas abyssi TaxID=2864871 RepID=A0ABS7EVW8_9FLAO|nr:hypothetical protein [Allomuricauda abyssi]MBW8201124.1 hypothetical protein [Allomuricauda abyssi]
MENNIIDVLNKILTNTLDYKQVLQKLADSITHPPTTDKLNQLEDIAEKETEKLIRIVSDLGGDVESSERLTDQKAIYWFPRPLPDVGDNASVWASLIKAERNKEVDYKSLLEHQEIDRKTKNVLKSHLKKTESNIRDFQSILYEME